MLTINVCAIQESHKMLCLVVDTSQSRNLNSNFKSHVNLNSVDESFCRSVGQLFIHAEDFSTFGPQLVTSNGS